MFDAWLRAWKDRLFAGIAPAVGRVLSANALSLLAFAAGIGAAVLASRAAYLPALALWILNRILDGLDGSVARATGAQSDFGGYFDIVLDFVVYAAIPLGLVAAATERTTVLLGAALIGSFLVNAASWIYLAAILERRGRGAESTGERTTITMPPGLVAGFETFVFYALFLLLPALLAPLFALMIAGVAVNVVQRLLWARRVL